MEDFPSKGKCPVNSKLYSSVPRETITKHIKNPWNWQDKKQGYYFCDDSDCDVVYFGQDGSIITREQLRTKVGIKEKSQKFLLCYCYGVMVNDVNPNVKTFVIEKTKNNECACESMNPSGRCCLKDFPK